MDRSTPRPERTEEERAAAYQKMRRGVITNELARPLIRRRFWSKIDNTGGPDACWPWLAAIGHSGAGQLTVGRYMLSAHRVAWELTHGPIPAGQVVIHACGKAWCCNPAHLKIGPLSDAHVGRRKPIDACPHGRDRRRYCGACATAPTVTG